MKFSIKTITKEGVSKEKVVEADDKAAVFKIVKETNEELLTISEAKSSFEFSLSKINEKLSTVKEKDKIIFARNLGAMLEAGLAVTRAVFVIKKQTSNAKFRKVLDDVENSLKGGSSLSASLDKHPEVFPRIFISMVKAGEESGGLTESLKVISDQMEKVYLLKKKIRGALMYPGIVLSAVVVIGFLMMTFVVPTLTETFKELDIDLPLSTRAIILVSDFMKDHTFLFLGTLIGLIVLIYSYLKTPNGKRNFEFLLLHTPLISGLVKETNSARTARTLASLLSSGVEVVSSLSITREVIQNSYYKEVLKEAEEKVQKGVPLSEIFAEHEKVYPLFVSEMISVGEETGKMSDMFLRTALFYEESIDQKTKNMSTIIEPFLMIFIGGVVGFFAFSMITPTYSLVDGL
jgi:type II secretory pathway component PulF